MRRPGNGDRDNHFPKESKPLSSGVARHRWGIILAGGDGTRLQPLTRLACGDNRPKQFCPLLGGETLLERTRQRISPAIDPDRVLFVLTKKHEPFYREELNRVAGTQLIVQPQNQGTLPAILWSLLRLFQTDEHALVAFFPSDHYFANPGAFLATIERMFAFAAEQPGSVILLGAGAERPETEYGWIEPVQTEEAGLRSGLAPVRRFWEKPALETARELLAQGCLWNTFVMIGSAAAFLKMIREAEPALFDTFTAALRGSTPDAEEHRMKLVYDSLAPSDFSRQVLAINTDRLLVASCGEAGWSDLGEPRRFLTTLMENGVENPWASAEVCNKCRLTREQVDTLTGRATSDVPLATSLVLVPSA